MPDSHYQDDTTIQDEDDLWRRIPPNWIVPDENRGGWRPASQAFNDHPDGSPMSVKLAKEERIEDVMASHSGFFLVAISAGLARQCEQKVARDPLPDNSAPAVVVGKKKGSVRAKFAKEARWVVAPSALARGPQT
jgi:hypothetical protein